MVKINKKKKINKIFLWKSMEFLYTVVLTVTSRRWKYG